MAQYSPSRCVPAITRWTDVCTGTGPWQAQLHTTRVETLFPMRIPTKRGAAVLTAALLLATAAQSHAADTNANGADNHFDLEAHRGGIGLTVESTLASFAKGLETGVSTLELDLQITKDGREVITHD